MDKRVDNEEDSVSAGDCILPFPLFCIHPVLRDRIESQDRAALYAAADLFVNFATPAESAAVHSDADPSRHAEESREHDWKDFSSRSESCENFMPLTTCYASPESHRATLKEADIELGRRCRYLLSIFDADDGETRYVPADLRRRIVPILYAWVVDWDFFLRSICCWEDVARCFYRFANARRQPNSVRPDFTLPCRPLTTLLRSLFFQPCRVMELHAFHTMRGIAGKYLDRVCEVASQHFGPEALQELWEVFAPYFSEESEEAPLMLCLFSHLLPIHRLVDDDTNAPLPLTKRIVRFLLEDSARWQQYSTNWMSYSLKIVFKMSFFHVGILEWDKYAEPLFSMMLFAQRLPMGGSNETPRIQSTRGFGLLKSVSLFHLNKNETSMAMGYVVGMLSDQTGSPLWNQLRRFIHATSIFMRPNATDKNALIRVFSFYSSLVVSAFRRMKAQRTFLRNRKSFTQRASKGFVRPIPDAHIWSPSTVYCFVELVAPVVLTSLHHRLSDTPLVLGYLAALAPSRMQELVLPYVDAGLRSCAESPQQCSVALHVLTKILYPLSECRGTREEFWVFVENVLSRVLMWMNTNDSTLSSRVLDFIYSTCTVVNLRQLLGGEDAECSFAIALIEKLFECANHVDLSDCFHMNLSHVMLVLCMNVCDTTLQRCVDCALREAEAQGTLTKARAVAVLLEPIARHAPSQVLTWAARVLMPPLRSLTTTDGGVEWYAELLSGCVRGAGLAAFVRRDEIMNCVQIQLSQVVRPVRFTAAATLYAALYAALSTTVCVDGRAAGRRAPLREADDCDSGDFERPGDIEFGDADGEEGEEEEEALRMRFCRGTSVQLTWREPSEEHMVFLVDTYRHFVEDAVEVMRCIDSVTRIDRTNSGNGLRAFILQDADSYGNSQTGGEAEPGVVSEDCDDDSAAVTSQNVLRGVLLWMHHILLVNQELRVQCEQMVGAPNIMPWWEQNPRAVWKLPLFPAGTTLPLFSDSIGDALREYALCRVADGVAERHSIITAALRQQFGAALPFDFKQNKDIHSGRGKNSDSADASPADDSSLLLSSCSSSHSGRADETNLRGLCTLLSILAEQCNVNMSATPLLTSDKERVRVMNRFRNVPLETLGGKHYLPAMCWRFKAESFLLTRRNRALHVVPPRRLSQLFALCYALLYSPHHAVRSLCSGVLQSSLSLLGAADVRRFLALHLDALEHIAENWTTGERAEKSGGDSERGASRSVVRARWSSEDEKAHSSQLKRELSSACLLAFHGFWSPHFCRDERLIQRTYTLIMRFPEKLKSKRVGGDDNFKGPTTLGAFLEMEQSRALRLADELLLLASRFVSASPGRAFACLMMIVAVYRPSHAALLSRQSVQLLFRLTVNTNTKVRETAFHILQCLLLSLKKPCVKAHVLTRRGTLEAEGDVEFFRHRYEILRRRCASFYGIREVGLAFAPHFLRVDVSDVTPGMFNDGEAETIPSDVAFFRRQYIQNDTTPEFDRNYDEITSVVGQFSGMGEEAVPSDNLFSIPCSDCKRCENPWDNESSSCSNIRDNAEKWSVSMRNSESEKCKKGNNINNNDSDSNSGYCAKCVSRETLLRNGWVWAVMQERRDQQSFSPSRMRMWKALGKVSGVNAAVRYLAGVVRLQIRDYMDLTRGNAAEAKESPRWLFACLADILVAMICMSKRHAEARRESLTCYTKTLLLVCTSNRVPNEACIAFVSGINFLQSALHPGEVSSLYDALFTTFSRVSYVTGVNKQKNYDSDDNNQNNSNGSIGRLSEVNARGDDDDAVIGGEGDGCHGAHGVAFTAAAKTQEISRVLSAIFHLLSSFSREINVLLLPQLSHLVLSNKNIFLYAGSTNIRRFAATALRQVMCLSLQHSPYVPANASVLCALSAFVDALRCAVERLPLPLPPPAPRPVLAPWCATPACGPAAHGPAPRGAGGESPGGPLPALRLESPAAQDSAAALAAVKTLAMCWCGPPPALLEARICSVIAMLAQALDIALPEMDDLYETVRVTLNSIALVRLPKEVVHSAIQMLCDILGEKMTYGTSRHAKIILCEMLRLMLFTNLHRVGKFVTMQNVAETTLQSIGHGDGRLRREGKLLLAVLTRVASAEQTQALVQTFFCQLREVNSVSATGPSPSSSPTFVPLAETVHRRRRIALLIALCSIAAASPGSVPVYGPRLMERLVPYANDAAPEVRRTVRQTFGEWWRSHRDGWELQHKPYFTKAQIEVMAPLLTASTYLV